MSPHGLYWDARAHLKKSNAVARDLFIFVAFIYDHPVIRPRSSYAHKGVLLALLMCNCVTNRSGSSFFCIACKLAISTLSPMLKVDNSNLSLSIRFCLGLCFHF